jgi:DNA topoisomerase II
MTSVEHINIDESISTKSASTSKPKIKIKQNSNIKSPTDSQIVSLINKPKIKIKSTNKRKSTGKKASEIYKKMEHVDHIKEKPDTYIGSAEKETTDKHIYNEASKMIEFKNISVAPGFYKCFDELLVNSHDHKQRMKKIAASGGDHHMVTTIKIDINEDGSISFYNDGDGILIEYMEEHKMYPPELIFGSLLTGSNFDDGEEREWGGRNGYGAKLANIFSKKFSVETVCHINNKKFKQEFMDNMSNRTKPEITNVKMKPFTKITWLPDYERFGMNGLEDSVKELMIKRVYDIAGITDKETKVYLNGKILESKTFDKYVNLYLPPGDEIKTVFAEAPGWQVVACSSTDDIFEQVSFVNGINTSRGGTHVDYIADQIKSKLVDILKKKKKIDIKPQIVKNQLRLFINASKIINPAFDSQTKETLKTPKQKFGCTYDIPDKFINQLLKTDIFDKIQAQAAFKNSQLLSKTDGKKSKRVQVAKLCDANKAGTSDSKKCTIIFTEGDSAKTMAISGLASMHQGREYYGVYPLRGKILNVRDAPNAQIMNCAVLNDIKKILGLSINTDYKTLYEKTETWPLRYGKIMIMTDQDHDGSHIKGLMMNIFDSMWSNLIELGFITSMITPIIKAFKNSSEKSFYTIQDYEKWKKKENSKGWRIKYYKGLGTSTTKEAKEYFKQLKVVTYNLPEESIDNLNPVTDSSLEADPESKLEDNKSQQSTNKTLNDLDLAFNKKRSHDRKEWLIAYNKINIPDYNNKNISVNEFVNQELIHFSNEDNDRSIPNIMDGCKPSQRKVLYGSFKRNLKTEIKVAQLAGYISEHAAYHHGEVSLEKTIKNMAQDFVSSNNLNYLCPIGQFGSRLMGGDDAAQSRYIFTKLSNITRTVFKKNDDCLVKYLDDDGDSIEPEYYYPIIPTILVNGSTGIGTGFSTDVPKHNPIDISQYILDLLDGKTPKILKPWYRGFNGVIEPTSIGSYITRGRVEYINDSTLRITELPIGSWTEKYVEFLNKISVERGKETAKNFIRTYTDNSTETQVDITVKINPVNINKWRNKFGKDGVSELENRLKLTSSIGTSNMHMFDENCKITKFYNVESIIEKWFTIRKEIYIKRRDYLLNQLKKELDIIKFKVKFIEEIINDTILFKNVKKAAIILNLEEKNYPKISLKDTTDPSYDYLLGMDLYKLTKEEIDDLKQKKEFKESEYNILLSKTATELWKEDIHEFINIYTKELKDYTKEHGPLKSTVKLKKTKNYKK